MSPNDKRIENNTARPIHLSPTESHPQGKVLLPGLNTVPGLLWEELMAFEVEKFAGNQQRPTGVKRFPGREHIAQLQEETQIVTSRGLSYGPQITVYEDAQVGREDGVPMPVTLKGVKDIVAAKYVELCNERKTLKRWAEEGGEFAHLAKTKLAAMGSAK